MRLYVHASSVLAGVILMLALPVEAHHSTSVYYDTTQTIEINGILKVLRVVNPHASIVVEVTNEAGQKEDWLGVGGFAANMIRVGWTNDTLPLGIPIRVEGAPARQAGAKGLLIRRIILESGRVLTTGNID